jgi:hypothetical protein
VEPTGDLGRLMAWWHTHGCLGPPQVAWLANAVDAATAETQVDRAVDQGATLIVVHIRGDSLSARTAIAELTKTSPAHVRPIEDGMTDIDWMREVATIRDLKAKQEPPAPTVLAAAAALRRARQRSTPVIFSGLTTHAGALMIEDITDSFLPASSSTDAAITAAQDFLELRPALDLQLASDDEYGPRAVVALLELLREG